MKKTLLSIILFGTVTLTSAGDGWVQSKKEGYLKLSQWWLVSDKHYTSTGQIDPNQTRATYVTSIYGEYGISDRLTAVLYFPFFTRSLSYDQESATTGEIIQEGEAINSVGDTELTVKYGLLQKGPVFLAGSYSLGIPFGTVEGGSDGSLQTGIGEFYHIFRLDASTSFNIGGKYPFVSVYGAYNQRTKNYSNEFRYGFKTGVELNKWILILQAYGVGSFKNIQNNFNTTGTSIFGNNMEFFTISPEVGFKFNDHFGLSANIGAAIWGRLILAAPSYSVGVFWIP
ncbi:MAG: hypothetical protein MI975_28285 [Cytophagales bacterium]|nr:hypothetical protein [Cytophagales bacterium]